MTKSIVKLDQKQIQHELLTYLNDFAVQVEPMLKPFDELMDMQQPTITGVIMDRLEGLEGNQGVDGETVSELVAGKAKGLRRNKKLKAQLNQVLANYTEQVLRIIRSMQAKTYRDGQKQIAKIWNRNTPDGLDLKVKVSAKELKTVYEYPLNGDQVSGWIDDFVAVLQRKLYRAMSLRVAPESGLQDGRKLLRKKLTNAINEAANNLRELAMMAVNQANALAYEAEALAFSSKAEWRIV